METVISKEKKKMVKHLEDDNKENKTKSPNKKVKANKKQLWHRRWGTQRRVEEAECEPKLEAGVNENGKSQQRPYFLIFCI